MEVNINDKDYTTYVYHGEPLDMYYYKGVLYDNLPKGCTVHQYVNMDDGSIVGICSKKTWRVALILVLGIVCTVIIIGLCTYLVQTIQERRQPKSDIEVLDDSTENAVISVIKDTDYILRYNRYTIISDGYIDIMYQNVDKDATLYIDGLSDKVTVGANEYLPTMAVTLPDDCDMPFRASLIVSIDGEKYVVPIVINDKDSVEYQEVRKTHSEDNRVDLNNGVPAYDTESEWADPSTFKDEERIIHD